MIWIMLVTLAVVFLVGFRLLTARPRHAVNALSKRLKIEPVHLETMLSLMGKEAEREFITYIISEQEVSLHNAAVVLLIWQVFIVDDSEENLLRWHGILHKAGFPVGISRQQSLLALGFLRQLEPENMALQHFRQRYNDHFIAQMGQTLEAKATPAIVQLNDWRGRE